MHFPKIEEWLARRLLRDPKTGKKIFFYPSVGPIDQRFLNYIESNGGRHDIIAVIPKPWKLCLTPLAPHRRASDALKPLSPKPSR